MSGYFARLAQRSEVVADTRPRSAQVRPGKGEQGFAEQAGEVVSTTADPAAGSKEAAPPPNALDSTRAHTGSDFAPPQSSALTRGIPSLASADGMEGALAAMVRPQPAALPPSGVPPVFRASAAASSESLATDRDVPWIEAPDMTGSDAATASTRGAHAGLSDPQRPTDVTRADSRRIDASSTPSALVETLGSFVDTPSARTTVARPSAGAAPVEPSARVARANDSMVQVNIGRIELEINAPAPAPIPMREAAPPSRPAPQRAAPFNPHRHYLRGG